MLDVDTVLVLQYYHTNKKSSSATAAQEEEWSPSPSTEAHLDRMPNQACLWVDPFWTGLTCQRTGPVVVAERRLTTSVVFHVQGRFQPRARSTVQRLGAPTAAQGRQRRSVCNSVKLHFFAVQPEGREQRSSFVYASAIPLEQLFSSCQNNERYGVFNYNRCDNSSAPVPGFELLLLPLSSSPPCRLRLRDPEEEVCVFALAGPQDADHARTTRVSEWITDVLERLCPDLTTDFRNMRTFCRDQNSVFLFQDLQRLFETPGTCLPPTLALYAAHAALRLLLLSRDDTALFVRTLLLSWMQVDRFRLMRFVRDLFACFTLCAVEGLYWPDLSLSRSVEDQPSPLDFMPSQRVFTKDDCEGRATQVQQVVLLLRWMHRSAQVSGFDALLRTVRGMRSFAVLLATCDVEQLLRVCCHIGDLLEQGVLDVQTVVGDVHFASMQSPVQTGTTTGHSFVVCFLRDPALPHIVLHTQVIEATGWERTTTASDHHRNKNNYDPLHRALQALMSRYKQSDARSGGVMGNVCGLMPPDIEDHIYERLVLGNDCIFFTGRIGSQQVSPEYGARLSHVRHALFRYPHLPQPQSVETARQFAFTITTREFLQALCPPPKKGMRLLLWPPQPGAEAILADYEHMQANLPNVRRCLRPPQKDEATVERIMCATWAPILFSEWHDDVKEEEEDDEGVLFSVPTLMNSRRAGTSETLHAEIEQALRLLVDNIGCVRSFAFMSSRLFHVTLSKVHGA